MLFPVEHIGINPILLTRLIQNVIWIYSTGQVATGLNIKQ